MWSQYFSDDACNKGLSDNEIIKFQKASYSKLGFFLPFQYAELLKTVNGYKNNEKMIYAADNDIISSENTDEIEGYIVRNTYIRANHYRNGLLYIGETPKVYYAYNYLQNQFVSVDRKTLDVVKVYFCFNDILSEITNK